MTRWVAVGGVVLVAMGCGSPPGAPSPPSTPTPQPTPGVEQITGRERLGWDQPAGSAAELASLRYNVYLDSMAISLAGASCAATAGPSGYACSAPLPPMSPGAHTLELSAVDESNASLESARSTALRVFVVGGAAQPTGEGRARFSTRDGVAFNVDVVGGGLVDPVDVAIAPDGRVFVAERSGRVMVIDERRSDMAVALLVPDVVQEAGGGLLALAFDPTFEENGLLFATYTSAAGMELARFRLVGATLGERAILLDRVVASPTPAASLRFGPDARLYLAVDDGGDVRAAGDLGSFNGKVLRLNPDGTTPVDQAGGTPVYAVNVNGPRGLAWDSAATTLWVLERDPDGVDRLQAVVGDGSPGRRGTAAARYSLPPATGASALVIYQGAAFPAFRDNVLVAADEGRSVLRLAVDRADRWKITSTERLLEDAVGGIRALGVGPDGSIYLCTFDTLLKLNP